MSGKRIVSTLLKYLLLIAVAVAIVLPIIIVFLGAFKGNKEFLQTSLMSLPKSFLNFDNFITAFRDGRMHIGFLNTAIILLLSLGGAVLSGAMTAFVLSRFDFKFNLVVKAFFAVGVMIPTVTTQVATFQIIHGLGLYNTIFAPVVLYIGTDIMTVYIFLQFLENIPKELDEAAILDGASYLMIFRKIILPLLAPASITVCITKGISIYNDFYIPFLYMPKEELLTISTTLFKFKGPYGARWEVICAGIIVVVIPVLVIFICLQKHIYNGLVQGAVKE